VFRVILDANVVILLHELEIWEKVCSQCQIYLSEAVVAELKYYEAGGQQKPIDHEALRAAVTVCSVTVGELKEFFDQFDPTYQQRLDPGELESLVYLFKQTDASEDLIICSADAIVFRILGCINKSDRGISLEELLQGIGLTKKLPEQYCRGFRIKWTKIGQEDALQDRGKRSPPGSGP